MSENDTLATIIKAHAETHGATGVSQGDVRRQWLEARVRSLYASTLDEEIPEEMMALVIRLGRAN